MEEVEVKEVLYETHWEIKPEEFHLYPLAAKGTRCSLRVVEGQDGKIYAQSLDYSDLKGWNYSIYTPDEWAFCCDAPTSNWITPFDQQKYLEVLNILKDMGLVTYQPQEKQ